MPGADVPPPYRVPFVVLLVASLLVVDYLYLLGVLQFGVVVPHLAVIAVSSVQLSRTETEAAAAGRTAHAVVLFLMGFVVAWSAVWPPARSAVVALLVPVGGLALLAPGRVSGSSDVIVQCAVGMILAAFSPAYAGGTDSRPTAELAVGMLLDMTNSGVFLFGEQMTVIRLTRPGWSVEILLVQLAVGVLLFVTGTSIMREGTVGKA